ncbi:MAG: hypothetical protein U1G08_05785 [Verrucomicrobiota bacterium]
MSDSRSSFFRQSAWLAFGTVVGGVFMTAVHPVVFRMERSQYEIFSAMLRAFLLLGIPSAGLMTSFAQQGAAALTPEARARLATTTQRVLCGIVLLWLVLLFGTFLVRERISTQLRLGDGAVLWPTLGVGLMWLILPVMRGLLQGEQDFYTLGWVAILDGLLRICLILLTVLVLHLGAAAALYAAFFAMVASTGVALWRTRGIWTARGSPVDWPEWLRRVLPFTLGAGAMLLISNVDVLYFQSILTQELADKFALGNGYIPAALIGFALVQFTVPLAMVMFPKIARSAAGGGASDALTLALVGTLVLGALAAGFVTLFPTFPLRIVFFNKPDAIAAAPVVPGYAWAMVAYSLANVLVSNLLARGRFLVVPWALLVAGAYLVNLYLLRNLLPTLPPVDAYHRVTHLLCGYSLVLLAGAALMTWNPFASRGSSATEH